MSLRGNDSYLMFNPFMYKTSNNGVIIKRIKLFKKEKKKKTESHILTMWDLCIVSAVLILNILNKAEKEKLQMALFLVQIANWIK